MKIAIGITAIVATVAVADSPPKIDQPVTEIRAELEARLDKLRAPLLVSNHSQEQHVAQWGNWPNWQNWPNAWRNY